MTRRQLMLDYPTNVEFNYRSRAGLRTAGGMVTVLSLLAGVLVTFVDLTDSDGDAGLATTATLGVAIPGLIAGIVLLSIGDASELKVTPMPGHSTRQR
jgi:hypothetical protein